MFSYILIEIIGILVDVEKNTYNKVAIENSIKKRLRTPLSVLRISTIYAGFLTPFGTKVIIRPNPTLNKIPETVYSTFRVESLGRYSLMLLIPIESKLATISWIKILTD